MELVSVSTASTRHGLCKVYRSFLLPGNHSPCEWNELFAASPLTLSQVQTFLNSRKLISGSKVRGKILAMAAGIDIQNDDGINGVEIFLLRQSTPGVNHARIKSCA